MRLGEGRLVHAALVGADGAQRVEVGKHAIAVGLCGIVGHQAIIRTFSFAVLLRARPALHKAKILVLTAGISPELCQFVVPLGRRGQGKPGADCARSPVCEECYRNAHGLNYRYSQDIPAFPAQWVYGLYVISPGSGLSAPVADGRIPVSVAPGSRRQDHTTSPYAAGVSSGGKTRLTP